VRSPLLVALTLACAGRAPPPAPPAAPADEVARATDETLRAIAEADGAAAAWETALQAAAGLLRRQPDAAALAAARAELDARRAAVRTARIRALRLYIDTLNLIRDDLERGVSHPEAERLSPASERLRERLEEAARMHDDLVGLLDARTRALQPAP